MRGLILLAAAAVLSIAAAPAGKADIAALGWMSGSWLVDADGEWTEERWGSPRGGVMLGTNLAGRGERAGGFEFIRIAADDKGELIYWGSPGGKPAVPFRLTSTGAGQVVFENPAHDYPTRIAYRREGNLLIAETSGPEGSPRMRWRFRRRGN